MVRSESRLISQIEKVLAQLKPKGHPSSQFPSSPPSSIPESVPYDVYLNVRGADTRYIFTDHLYDRLVMAGIHTYMDDGALERGEDIYFQQVRAIEESKFYIVIFSLNYASSSRCLDDLVKILLECKKNSGRRLLPVFYGVDTTDVHRQRGGFGVYFRKHKGRYSNQLDKINEWEAASTEAANFLVSICRVPHWGIRTFMDDDGLNPGGDISQQLMTAIEESRIYIVVFSDNYASSRWCLDELVKMLLECKTNSNRRLLPVFYDVDPSDVHYQRGRFEEAFKHYEENGWQAALTEAANKSGFVLQMGSESRLLNLIVEEVLAQAKPKELVVAMPVGLDSHVNDVYDC